MMEPKLYDSQGNEVLCKCGKPSDQTFIGIDYFIARCKDCLDVPSECYNLIYIPKLDLHSQERIKKANEFIGMKVDLRENTDDLD